MTACASLPRKVLTGGTPDALVLAVSVAIHDPLRICPARPQWMRMISVVMRASRCPAEAARPRSATERAADERSRSIDRQLQHHAPPYR
jgi:hypothetical protein